MYFAEIGYGGERIVVSTKALGKTTVAHISKHMSTTKVLAQSGHHADDFQTPLQINPFAKQIASRCGKKRFETHPEESCLHWKWISVWAI